MRFLGVHPAPLLYTKVFLRLEPLGLELVAQSARRAGHDVQLIDLQVEEHRAYFRLLQRWQPEVIAFFCNYLANVPEIIDLAKATKMRSPRTLFRALSRRAEPGTRFIAPSSKIFHGHARSLRFDRVLSRLSLGLFVL